MVFLYDPKRGVLGSSIVVPQGLCFLNWKTAYDSAYLALKIGNETGKQAELVHSACSQADTVVYAENEYTCHN